MLEFEEDSKKSKIAKFDAPGIEVYMTVWILGKFWGFLWIIVLESKVLLFNNFFPYKCS